MPSGSVKSARRSPCCIWKPARSRGASGGPPPRAATAAANGPRRLAVGRANRRDRLRRDVDAVLAGRFLLHGDVRGDQVARRHRAGHHAGLRVLQRLLPAERLDVFGDDFVDRLGRRGRLLRSGAAARSAAALGPAGAPARPARRSCARRACGPGAPGPPGPPGPPRPPRPRPAAAAAASAGVMSIASGGVRTGFARPLWHDAQLTRGLPSKNFALSLVDHLHHLAGALLRVLVVEVVLPLHVTVVALHAQRRRDVLHRQLQLVERDVLEDLDVLRRLRTAAPAAGRLPGGLGCRRRRLLREGAGGAGK